MAHTDKSRQQHSSSFKGHMVTCWRTDFSTHFEEAIEEGVSTFLFQYQQKCLENNSTTEQQKINLLHIWTDSLHRLKASAFISKVCVKS